MIDDLRYSSRRQKCTALRAEFAQKCPTFVKSNLDVIEPSSIKPTRPFFAEVSWAQGPDDVDAQSARGSPTESVSGPQWDQIDDLRAQAQGYPNRAVDGEDVDHALRCRVAALVSVNTTLQTQVQELRRSRSQLSDSNDALQRQVDELKREGEKLLASNGALQQELDELKKSRGNQAPQLFLSPQLMLAHSRASSRRSSRQSMDDGRAATSPTKPPSLPSVVSRCESDVPKCGSEPPKGGSERAEHQLPRMTRRGRSRLMSDRCNDDIESGDFERSVSGPASPCGGPSMVAWVSSEGETAM